MSAPAACRYCGSDDLWHHQGTRAWPFTHGGCNACESRYAESKGEPDWTSHAQIRAFRAAQFDPDSRTRYRRVSLPGDDTMGSFDEGGIR